MTEDIETIKAIASDSKARINRIVDNYEELEKENTELKAQIEKMKCCGNCKHYTQKSNYLLGICKNRYNVEGNNICDDWEFDK